MSKALTPQRELWLLITLAGIQFTHILDFMIMMPLAPQLMRLWDIGPQAFGVLVSAYTFAAAASGLLSVFVIDRYDRARNVNFEIELSGLPLGDVKALVEKGVIEEIARPRGATPRRGCTRPPR